MPVIKPFKGILYNTQNVQLPEVVAPPYDVISPQQQEEFYKIHPQNIIRLILGKEEDRYASAARFLQEWFSENVLFVDNEPALYILAQSFTLPDGKKVVRKGFIAACQLEDIGKGSIFPHEKTLSKPKEDRLKLFQSTNAMFSQIFCLYNDGERELDTPLYSIMQSPAEREVVFEGVLNRLWKLRDKNAIESVTESFKKQNVLIADGHHRYETALAYRDLMRTKNPGFTGNEAFNYVPMFFTNMNDPGLIILPTHRIVHSLQNFNPEQLFSQLEKHFNIEKFTSLESLEKSLLEKSHAFGLALPGRSELLLLELKSLSSMSNSQLPEIVANLDVAILHSLILKEILGISEEAQLKKINLDYFKDAKQAIDAVNAGKAQAAFLMNYTPVHQVREVAEAGFVLPQKSTYFYPKLLSGIVSYSFIED